MGRRIGSPCSISNGDKPVEEDLLLLMAATAPSRSSATSRTGSSLGWAAASMGGYWGPSGFSVGEMGSLVLVYVRLDGRNTASVDQILVTVGTGGSATLRACIIANPHGRGQRVVSAGRRRALKEAVVSAGTIFDRMSSAA